MDDLLFKRFIVIDNAANNRRNRRIGSEKAQRKQLLFGKSVLLIGNNTAVLQNLVTQLAKKGADIALLCWQIPLEIARKMKESVRSFGRQLVLIERAEYQRISVEQLIHDLVNRWGHFDIFIDMSTRSDMAGQQIDEAEANDPQAAWPSKWQLTQTVLEKMAQS